MRDGHVKNGKLVICIIFVMCLIFSGFAQAAVTWSNPGTQTLTVNSNFYPTSMTRYVALGGKIVFDVGAIVEKDKKDDCGTITYEDDSQKQGRLKKSGGTCPVAMTPLTFSSTGKQTFTVTSDPNHVGKTITIVAELHDTRGVPDLRWDDWSTKGTWTFTISDDCPDSMSASMADQSGSRPNAGETYGKYYATMSANGTPPAGRSNWNGTVVTETVGASVGDSSDWITGVIGGSSHSGSTFTFGTYGDNNFKDTHTTSYAGILLASGVNNASYTRSQDYKCSSTKTYSFTITRTGDRLDPGGANERVKITITK